MLTNDSKPLSPRHVGPGGHPTTENGWPLHLHRKESYMNCQTRKDEGSRAVGAHACNPSDDFFINWVVDVPGFQHH